MSSQLFWLSDLQWQAIAGLLPEKQRGPRRQDDRKIISGIVHVLQAGCVWRSCPREYGPYMTVFNRYNRWRRRGIWQQIAHALASDPALSPGIARPVGFPQAAPAATGLHLLHTDEIAPVAVGHGLSAPEGLELTLQLLTMLECVAFYATGSMDAGARAKAVMKSFKVPAHPHGHNGVAAAGVVASGQHHARDSSHGHYDAVQDDVAQGQSQPQAAHWPRRQLQEPA